jgi:hypothetical protein
VNFLKQKGILHKQEFCEKINHVNNGVCGSILKECYKNSRKQNSDGQPVKSKYLVSKYVVGKLISQFVKKIQFSPMSILMENVIAD